MDITEFEKNLVGKTFRRRKNGKQETRRVIDVTLGFGVVYCWGPRGAYTATVEYDAWEAWVKDAKEI